MNRRNFVLKSIKYAAVLGLAFAAERAAGTRAFVVDGDTLKIGRDTVRLNGVDAPELKQTCLCSGKETPCGQTAKDELIKMIGNKTAVCRVSERDWYGRFVGECFVSENGAGTSLNKALVESGLAVVPAGAPDAFFDAEAAAMKAKRGVWACRFDLPSDYRKGVSSLPR